MPPRKSDKPQMNEKDKIVALTHLEDGWKIAEVALDTVSSVQCPVSGSAGGGEETVVYGDSGRTSQEVV